MLAWLLFPFQCDAGLFGQYERGHEAYTLSQWLRGPAAPCTPWGATEAGLSITAVLLYAALLVLALVTCLLGLEAHPLSQAPGVRATGRPEAAWTLLRGAAVAVRFAKPHVVRLAALVLLCAGAAAALTAHVRALPFHSHKLNLLRGGLLAAVLWAAVASAALTALSGGSTGVASSATQAAMAAVTPLFMLAGVALVQVAS